MIEVATKGHLTVVDTGEIVRFMFNPNEISDNHGVNYARQGVPGISHPVLQYSSGGERVVSFELWLDGDRGRARRAPPNSLRDTQTRENTLTIQDDLDFFQSLTYPIETEGRLFTDIHAPPVLLTFGTMFQAMPCVITSAPVKVTKFDPHLNPIRGTVSLTFEEKILRSVKRSDIYVRGGGQ